MTIQAITIYIGRLWQELAGHIGHDYTGHNYIYIGRLWQELAAVQRELQRATELGGEKGRLLQAEVQELKAQLLAHNKVSGHNYIGHHYMGSWAITIWATAI